MLILPASRFPIQVLTEAYNQTRIDYVVPMPMNVARLQEYIQVYDVSLEDSAVATDGQDILGLCMLGLRPGSAWITRLGVLPGTRRQGVGSALMHYVLDRARLQGTPTIFLEVIEGNLPAHRLFDSLGFQAEERLLVLRRPPGAPRTPQPTQAPTWLDAAAAVACLHSTDEHVAWVNQPESFANASGVQGLYLEGVGWLMFQKSAIQIKRMLLGPRQGLSAEAAQALLWALHERFQTLDTIAENVPDEAPYLRAMRAEGYVEAFSRIEMRLALIS